MDVNQLIERYPRLFHLAEAGSAPAISEHGLLPAKEMVSTLDQLLNARRNRGRPHDIKTIEDYPFAERIRGRTPQAAVVELAVSGGVRDISGHVIDVYRRVA